MRERYGAYMMCQIDLHNKYLHCISEKAVAALLQYLNFPDDKRRIRGQSTTLYSNNYLLLQWQNVTHMY